VSPEEGAGGADEGAAATASNPVRLEREPSGLAILTLDRPPLNLFDRAMIDAVGAAVAALADEPPRALLIRAEGRAVSAGVDVNVFAGLSQEQGNLLWDELLRTIERLEELPAPVVFAAHALTLTAAFEIALACDLIVAGRDAIFGLPEARHGLLAAGGGLFGLTRRVPQGAALELALTGEPIGAERAHEIGAVDALTEPGEALAAAHELAARIALNAPLSLAAGKDLLRRGWTASEAEFFELQNELAAPLLDSDDAAEGVRAFNVRRPPRWSGR
jgi:enoyl-CoA hydratase/carnithine racemase